MSPVNLGDLSSVQPVATGLCQIKRGNFNGQTAYTAGVAAGTVILDGAGSPMQISITPSRPGWWLVRGQSIWSQADAAWYYQYWRLNCSPADADGWADDYNYLPQYSTLSWQESCFDSVFRLNAGITYSATMLWGSSNAGTHYLWTGPDYTYLFGEFVGEGQL